MRSGAPDLGHPKVTLAKLLVGAHPHTMTVEEVKNELRHMEAPVLQDLTSFILQLRRSLDPERKQTLAEKLDSPASKWIPLDEMEKRLGEE